jgi:hypothetical protein
MDPVKEQRAVEPATPSTAAKSKAASTASSPMPAAGTKPSAQPVRPVLPPEIVQYFVPVRGRESTGATLVYHPMLFGSAEVQYSDTKSVELTQTVNQLCAITDGPIAVDWGQASAIDVPVADLETTPETNAGFTEPPNAVTKAKNFEAWKKDFAGWIYRNQRLELFESPSLNVVSNPGESERDFRVRLQQLARERRDESVEKLRQKYAPKIAVLDEQQRRAQQAVDREEAQAKNQKLQTAISIGATLLSSFMGRKTVNLSTLGRATTAARGVGRSMKENEDVDRAEQTVEAVAQKRAELDAQFKADTDALERSTDPQTESLEKVSLKPTKANIAVKFVCLAWIPYWRDAHGQVSSAFE